MNPEVDPLRHEVSNENMLVQRESFSTLSQLTVCVKIAYPGKDEFSSVVRDSRSVRQEGVAAYRCQLRP